MRLAFLPAVAAQAAGSALCIGLISAYSYGMGGREAWPVLLWALAASFGLELWILSILLPRQTLPSRAALIAAILVSWLAGVGAFLALNMPKLAWLIAAAVLFALSWRRGAGAASGRVSAGK